MKTPRVTVCKCTYHALEIFHYHEVFNHQIFKYLWSRFNELYDKLTYQIKFFFVIFCDFW